MTVEAQWEPDKSKNNTNEANVKGLANNAQNPVKIRTNFGFQPPKSISTYLKKLKNLLPTPLITLVCINNQQWRRITLYAHMNEKTLVKVTEINSEVLTQSEKPVDFENTKTQESFLYKIFTLMNKNPNYKMLGALGMMLVNFSVCVTIANWLKHSSLVS